MKEKWKNRIVEKIKSLRFRIFIVSVCVILIPIIVLSLFLVSMATNGYIEQKMKRFMSNNTMLKNRIVSEGYIENSESESINAQIEQLAQEYNCSIEVINSQHKIIKDTDASKIGKISISENVIKGLRGKNIV